MGRRAGGNFFIVRKKNSISKKFIVQTTCLESVDGDGDEDVSMVPEFLKTCVWFLNFWKFMDPWIMRILKIHGSINASSI